MSCKNNNEIISKISPHTIKKFELIAAYVEAWAHKLLEYGRNTGKCEGIVFIDCMCNSGLYTDRYGNTVEGTPIRVAKIIAKIMREPQYLHQQAWVYFNDLSSEKIRELKTHLPMNTNNFHAVTSVGDGNELLRDIAKKLNDLSKVNYLLVYDPYTASLDWGALMPFLKHWGEVIINHMVSDSIRGIPQVKRPISVSKYEQTYLTNIEELIKFGSDRTAYEERIESIIKALHGSTRSRYYIASYPFFNSNNGLLYDLLHCTSNINGFKLYKSTAWKTFGNSSSNKNSKVNPNQLSLPLDDEPDGIIMGETDNEHYTTQDIVKFVIKRFYGRENVPLNELWHILDEHPIFPSDLFKKDIKKQLKEQGFKVHKSTIDFTR